MNNIIAKAQYRIRRFAEVNKITLNEKILATPVKSIKEYVGESEYTFEEVVEDLKGEDAFYNPFDLGVMGPVIIYDERKFEEMDEGEQIQTIVHEYLHYAYDSEEDDAEDELVSFLIAFECEWTFEKAISEARRKMNLQNLKEAYQRKEIGCDMAEKLQTLTLEEVRKKLE